MHVTTYKQPFTQLAGGGSSHLHTLTLRQPVHCIVPLEWEVVGDDKKIE